MTDTTQTLIEKLRVACAYSADIDLLSATDFVTKWEERPDVERATQLCLSALDAVEKARRLGHEVQSGEIPVIGEPTEEMIKAGRKALLSPSSPQAIRVYKAMMAVAPKWQVHPNESDAIIKVIQAMTDAERFQINDEVSKVLRPAMKLLSDILERMHKPIERESVHLIKAHLDSAQMMDTVSRLISSQFGFNRTNSDAMAAFVTETVKDTLFPENTSIEDGVTNG